MKKLLLVPICALPILMSSCASIVSGENQSVSVNTTPVAGASCSMENDKGKWYIPSTPGSVTVHRSYNDLKVSCSKPGYHVMEKDIKSSTKAMAFGNALFGGVIGAGVDMADGAAYDYPTDIQVPMKRG